MGRTLVCAASTGTCESAEARYLTSWQLSLCEAGSYFKLAFCDSAKNRHPRAGCFSFFRVIEIYVLSVHTEIVEGFAALAAQ